MYFKPNMTLGVKEWIRKVCGKTFRVKDKETCEISVRVIDQEEERYSNQVNTCIADRIKEI